MNADNRMSIVQASTREQITDVVRRILADRGITRSFGAQDDLREVGLTSLDMVNLVLAVEAENRRARLAAELLASAAYGSTAERVKAFVEKREPVFAGR